MMLADRLKQHSAEERQLVISEAGIEALNAMQAGDDIFQCRIQADEVLLQALYAHAEYDLVRSYKEARERVGFWAEAQKQEEEPPEPEPPNLIISPY